MGNCLVTKLKGSVSADLPIYNEMSFDVPANSAFQSLYVQSIPNAIISMTGSVEGWTWNEATKIADASTPYTVSSTPSATTQLRIKGGSTGGRLIIHGIFGSDEGYSEGFFTYDPTYFNTLDCYKGWFKGTGVDVRSAVQGTISELAGLSPHMVRFLLSTSAQVKGAMLDLLPVKDTLTEISLVKVTDFECSMSDLGRFTNVTKLRDYRVLSGSVAIEDIIRSYIANGRTTGAIEAVFAPSHTFNGEAVEQSASELSWTATTATYKGVTVDL